MSLIDYRKFIETGYVSPKLSSLLDLLEIRLDQIDTKPISDFKLQFGSMADQKFGEYLSQRRLFLNKIRSHILHTNNTSAR